MAWVSQARTYSEKVGPSSVTRVGRSTRNASQMSSDEPLPTSNCPGETPSCAASRWRRAVESGSG
nr:hypothetical protein RVX_1616 [Nitratidesulfovibrio sp. HK-II]